LATFHHQNPHHPRLHRHDRIAAVVINTKHRKAEAKQTAVRVGEVGENTIDPAISGKKFPRQYDTCKCTSARCSFSESSPPPSVYMP
jgi:hypothetical protein